MDRCRRNTFIWLVTLVVAAGLVLPAPAYADEFWTLQQAADVHMKAGRTMQAVDLWRQICTMYQGKHDRDSLTRTATYSARIAQAMDDLGFTAEAVDAYRSSANAWTELGAAESARGPSRRADQIRTELAVFVGVAPAAQDRPQRPLALHEPATGAYIGTCSDANPYIKTDSVRKAAGFFGKANAFHLLYVAWDVPLPQAIARAAKEIGAGLQVAWEPDKGLDAVTDNAYVRSFAKQLATTGVPVFLRFAAEMNGDWTAWSGDAAKYVAKFRLVAQIMKQDAPNVAMVWAPNHVPEENMNDFYPGDDFVDWVGVNFYTDRYFIGDPSQSAMMVRIYRQGELADPLDHLKYVYEKYAARKPIMIAETGVSGYMVKTGEDFSAWAANNIDRLYGNLRFIYPGVKAIFYFDVERTLVAAGATMWANYSIVQADPMLAAYKRQIQSPYFISKPNVDSTVAFRQLDGFAGAATLALESYVRLPVPKTERVEYWLDGVLAASSATVPFAANLSIPDGNHALDVRAFTAGILRARRAYSITVSGGQATAAASERIAPPYSTYLTDISTHWAKADIESASASGVVKGYADHTYKPNASITRAEFYSLLARGLGLTVPKSSGPLTGVAPAHWAYALLQGGAALGVIPVEQYGGGFSADSAITRGEIAVMAVRALNAATRQSLPTASTGYSDDASTPVWQRAYILKASQSGLVKGYEDGSFRPERTATRAEALVIVRRAMATVGL